MLKSQAKVVDKFRDLIVDAQNYIWANAETGYREEKTSKYMENAFEKLGYELTKAGDIPGFYTVLDTGRPGPVVLVLGELDSLICFDHPDANPETGAVHCCGHSAQCAALLGLAAALKEPGVTDCMCGKIKLCAVPAEELIEIGYRSELIKEGKIRYLGGKTEFLSRGYFDDVDLAFMVHATVADTISCNRASVGLIAKTVTYKGVSAHAGGSPWNGCNALYAATQGLSAINAIRETFKEQDCIRVHPIITKGGNVVNAIPDTVIIESYVRGKTFDAIVEANKKVNRALCGAALSLGANVEIDDKPGYAPLLNDMGMIEMAKDAGVIFDDMEFKFNDITGTGSTDMGDLSLIVPSIHPYMPGSTGKAHGADYQMPNPDLTCVGSAKWQLAMLTLLLKDNAERANKIVEDFKPVFASKEEYLTYIDALNSSGNRIEYTDSGEAKVRL